MPYGQLRTGTAQTCRKVMYGAVALAMALTPAGALAATGVGTPIVGGAAVIPPIQRPMKIKAEEMQVPIRNKR